ncbi:uncharacterized protein [Paramisgurnus dabryanus]|uniref:uncharacterized protein n=1 Tax=Paramisgurnus dabryanus TaxID=90735 RepID=UPI003CCF6B33
MSLPLHNRFTPLMDTTSSGERKLNLPLKEQNSTKIPIRDGSVDLDLTKKYFKLLQAIHHSEILLKSVSENFYPPGMYRQVNKLTAFIKPSSPNPETLEKVKQNTTLWMNQNMTILREHYDAVIATGLQNIGVYNDKAFEKAVSWSRMRYKRKFTESSVETLKSMVQKPVSDVPSASLDSFPLLTRPSRLSRRKTYASALTGDAKMQIIETKRLSEGNIQQLNIPMQEDVSARATEPNVVLPAPPGVNLALIQVHRAASPQPRRDETENIESETSETQGKVEIEPQKRIQQGSVYKGELQICTNLDVSSSVAHVSSQVPRTTVGETPVTVNKKQEGERQMMTGDMTREMSLGIKPQSESLSHTPVMSPLGGPAPSVRQEPVRHRRTNRKIFDWEISINKKVVIMGDSNLSRVPFFTHADVQIDSFPGATFYHINGVLEKLSPQLFTEVVVLSVGLNNCLARQETTTSCKQLQQLLRTCRLKFPNAQVFVPLINFADALEKDVQLLIGKLNVFIEKKCQFLPDLNKLLFCTEPRDLIHWTPKTATNILEFWLDQLNF